MPESRDRDGLVYLQIDKPAENVRTVQKDFVGFLQNLLGNQLNLVIKVDGIYELPENKCEMAIFIQEQLNMATGAAPGPSDTFRVPTSILYANLLQVEEKLKQAGISGIKNRVAMSEDEINRYLDSAPPGVSEIQWENAKTHNPDKEKLLPVPLLGFNQLADQHNQQRLLCDQQLAGISEIKKRVAALSEQSAERQQRLQKYKENANELKRKVLRLICRQELARQANVEGMSKDEEVLLSGIEYIQNQIRSQVRPIERISDVKSHMRMAGHDMTSLRSSGHGNSGNGHSTNDQDSGLPGLTNLNNTLAYDLNNSSHINLNTSDPNSVDLGNFDGEEDQISKSESNTLGESSESYLLEMLSKQQSQLDCMVAMINGDMGDLKVINDDILEN